MSPTFFAIVIIADMPTSRLRDNIRCILFE